MHSTGLSKGKVERPFRQLQETFLPEVELDGVPTDLADLNRRAERWLTERVHGLASRSTGETPTARLAVERSFLSPLPRVRFDSDYVESRRVHNIVPFITVDGVRYSMPAETLGQLVEIRRRLDANEFTVSWAGRPAVTHQLGARGDTVWHPEHHAAAQAVALGRHRSDERHLRLVASTEPSRARLELGDGDFDVDIPDLDARYSLGGDLP